MLLSFILFVILTLLQVADIHTTNKALKEGNREANPVISWVMDKMGEDKWWTIKIPVVVGIGWLSYMQFTLLLLVLTLFYSWVTWHNYNLIKRK